MSCNDSAGVDRLQVSPLPLAAETVEIPPRDAILGSHDRRFWTQQRTQLGSNRGQAVGLDPQNDGIDLADISRVVRHLGATLKIPDDLAANPQAFGAHRLQMGPAGDQRNFVACIHQARPDEGPNGSGAVNREFHLGFSRQSIFRRRALTPASSSSPWATSFSG